MKLAVNGKRHEIPAIWQDASLLSVLRDFLGFTGTKFGCGKGVCGACTVHLNGQAARSCLLPLSAVQDGEITTIEGLADGDKLHPVQQAWIEESVPQCGYCQAGQMMTAAALLAQTPKPTVEMVTQEMNNNLCRCGTYPRIRRGVMRAAELAGKEASS